MSKNKEIAKFKTYPSYSSENKKTYHRRYMDNNPWISHYQSARDRCTRKGNPRFKYYGGKGVKFLLTIPQIKELWFRDNAASMKMPSIDRIDSNGNYEPCNCRFIENFENISRSKKGEKHHSAKLTEADVIKIRQMDKNIFNWVIAEMFGVKESCIQRVRTRKTWRHI